MRHIVFLFGLACVTLPALAQQKPAAVLIAYHSESGNTEKFAQAVSAGASSVADVRVVLRKAGDVTDEDILQADGVIVGTPVHWANISAEAKRFLDHVGAAFSKAKTNGEGRTAAAFCTGGSVANGKDLARLSILAGFLALRFVVLGGVDAYGFGTLGAQATTGPADPGLSDKELEEARLFGVRFATLTRQIHGAVPR